MSGHPHADLMAKAAEIAKTDKEWWEHFEIRITENGAASWKGFITSFMFDSYSEYRLKTRFIDINGHQVPEPVREVPEDGDVLYVVDTSLSEITSTIWSGCVADYRKLQYGVLHRTEENADIHRSALLSFTQK